MGRLQDFLKTLHVSSKVLTAIHDIMKLVLLTCWRHLPGFACGHDKRLLRLDGRTGTGLFHRSGCEDTITGLQRQLSKGKTLALEGAVVADGGAGPCALPRLQGLLRNLPSRPSL